MDSLLQGSRLISGEGRGKVKKRRHLLTSAVPQSLHVVYSLGPEQLIFTCVQGTNGNIIAESPFDLA
jgi:hypothetical protein